MTYPCPQSMLNNAKQEIQQLDDIVDQLRYQVQVGAILQI